MKATVYIWLITLPSGEDRVVPLLGGGLILFWERDQALKFQPIAEEWANRAEHGPYPLRLATMEEAWSLRVFP